MTTKLSPHVVFGQSRMGAPPTRRRQQRRLASVVAMGCAHGPRSPPRPSLGLYQALQTLSLRRPSSKLLTGWACGRNWSPGAVAGQRARHKTYADMMASKPKQRWFQVTGLAGATICTVGDFGWRSLQAGL